MIDRLISAIQQVLDDLVLDVRGSAEDLTEGEEEQTIDRVRLVDEAEMHVTKKKLFGCCSI